MPYLKAEIRFQKKLAQISFPSQKMSTRTKRTMRFLFPHGAIFYADNAKESAVADFRVKITDLSIQRYTRGGKDVIISHVLSIRERLNLYGPSCHVNYKLIIGCQCRQEMGKIPNFTDCERLKTPKTDCLLNILPRPRVLSAWIPGLLTLKIQGSVPP